MNRRLGWVPASALLLAACGGGSGGRVDQPPAPSGPPVVIPQVLPGSQDQASDALDNALDQIVDGPASFDSIMTVFGGEIRSEGVVDFEAEASESTTSITGGSFATGLGAAELSTRVLGRHIYVKPDVGDPQPCWFDYGEDNPLFAGDEYPWLHIAVAAVTDATAVGLVDDAEDVVVAEVPAVELLSVVSPKVSNRIPDAGQDASVVAPVVIELDPRGSYEALRFNIEDVVTALEGAGVDLVGVLAEAIPNAKGDAGAMIRAGLMGPQTVTFGPAAPPGIEAPADELLIDGSFLTSLDQVPEGDLEPCAADS